MLFAEHNRITIYNRLRYGIILSLSSLRSGTDPRIYLELQIVTFKKHSDKKIIYLYYRMSHKDLPIAISPEIMDIIILFLL